MHFWIITYSLDNTHQDIYVGDDYTQAWRLFQAEWYKLTEEQKKKLECFLLIATRVENFDSSIDNDWLYICDLSYINTLEATARWLNKWWMTDGNEDKYPDVEMNTLIECHGWTPNTESDFEICTFSDERLVITDNCKAEVLKL